MPDEMAVDAINSKLVLNKLIFANLTHRPVRTLLSVLAIAVEVTMILTLVGVSHGTLDSTKDRAKAVGADIMVRPPGSSVMSSLNSAPMSDKYLGLGTAAAARGGGDGDGGAVRMTFPDSRYGARLRQRSTR